jgi:hypothetical protein
MSEKIPEDIQKDMDRAVALHQRATSDFEKCLQFNKLMSDLLARLEDAGCYTTADKVMGILLECNPREGAHCDNATRIGNKMNGPLFSGKKR